MVTMGNADNLLEALAERLLSILLRWPVALPSILLAIGLAIYLFPECH